MTKEPLGMRIKLAGRAPAVGTSAKTSPSSAEASPEQADKITNSTSTKVERIDELCFTICFILRKNCVDLYKGIGVCVCVWQSVARCAVVVFQLDERKKKKVIQMRKKKKK